MATGTPGKTADSNAVGTTVVADGRAARRDRNRTRVLQAILELFAEGDLEPSPEAVAERVGLSPRSVYRYFDDREALIRAAIEYRMAEVMPHAVLPDLGQGPLDRRIRALATHRLRLYEHIGAMARASKRRAATDELVREQVEFTRRALREQIEQQFAPELDALPPATRRARLAAVDTLCELESLDHYRIHRGFSSPETCDLLVDALTALLTPEENRAQ